MIMIRRLHGTIVTLFTDALVLDVQGVGYEVFMAPEQIARVREQESLSVSVYTHVREDQLQLFGFRDESERQLFVWLLDVSGIGPKTALHIVGQGVSAVVQAVRQADTAFFQALPRVGKKVAQKLVVELQPKLGGDQALVLGPDTPLRADLRSALAGMGFAERDIARVLEHVDESWRIEEALRWAMRQLREGKHG